MNNQDTILLSDDSSLAILRQHNKQIPVIEWLLKNKDIRIVRAFPYYYVQSKSPDTHISLNWLNGQVEQRTQPTQITPIYVRIS
jgi:hypothetical protein